MFIFSHVHNYFIGIAAKNKLKKINKQLRQQEKQQKTIDTLNEKKTLLNTKIKGLKAYMPDSSDNNINKIVQQYTIIDTLAEKIKTIQVTLNTKEKALNDLRVSQCDKSNPQMYQSKLANTKKQNKETRRKKITLKREIHQENKIIKKTIKQYNTAIKKLTPRLAKKISVLQIKKEQEIQAFINNKMIQLQNMEKEYQAIEQDYSSTCSQKGTLDNLNNFSEKSLFAPSIHKHIKNSIFKNSDYVAKINTLKIQKETLKKAYLKENEKIVAQLTKEVKWFDDMKLKSNLYHKTNKMLEMFFSLTSFITLREGYDAFIMDNKEIIPAYYHKPFSQNIAFSRSILQNPYLVDEPLLAEQEQLMAETAKAHEVPNAIKEEKFSA